MNVPIRRIEPFVIYDEESEVIAAAIQFGAALAEAPETTRQQRKSILSTISALRRLPEATPGFSGDFCLDAMSDAVAIYESGEWRGDGDPVGYHRCWSVDYCSSELGCVVEILQMETPYPDVIHNDTATEFPFSLELRNGSRPARGADELRRFSTGATRWIAVAADPFALVASGTRLTVEAAHSVRGSR